MSVCGRNVLCESDSLLNHGAKIQHPPKPIIRFLRFEDISIKGLRLWNVCFPDVT